MWARDNLVWLRANEWKFCGGSYESEILSTDTTKYKAVCKLQPLLKSIKLNEKGWWESYSVNHKGIKKPALR